MTVQFTILTILIVGHFIGDFLFQSREMGKKKSKEFKWLWRHIFWIWFWAFIPLTMYFNHRLDDPEVWLPLSLSLFIAGFHGLIDICSWNLYGWLVKWGISAQIIDETYGKLKPTNYDQEMINRIHNFKFWEDHGFYVTIGADQLAHILTIIIGVMWIL